MRWGRTSTRSKPVDEGIVSCEGAVPNLGRRFCTSGALLATLLSFAQAVVADSNSSAPSPFRAAKAFEASTFRAPPGAPATSVSLEALDARAIAAVKAANTTANKRLQVGFARKIHASPATQSDGLAWVPVAGGWAARWEVIAAGAKAERIGLVLLDFPQGAELRFSGSAQPRQIFGPFDAHDIALDGHGTYWSPVLRGDTATVEIFVPAGAQPDVALATVSHFFLDPALPDAEIQAKSGSGACEIDVICRSSTDAALANTAKAVARMSFVDAGISYLCSGTLLNPNDGSFTPYFYTANHCISTQAVANTLTTLWMYQVTTCGGSTVDPGVTQLTGGATLLFHSSSSDVSFMRLNATPPAGAWYSGWDSVTMAAGTQLVGIHHPNGDWKKVSLATMGGSSTAPGLGGSFSIANWFSGVTEPGSSGSGIFTAVGAPATDYKLRGGLWGGASACGAGQGSPDYYSRFDIAYPSIQQYLNAPVSTYLLTVSRAGNGSGTVTSSPPGINCGATCAAPFTSGASVSLAATATTGSVFTGWSGACAGSAACTLSMTAARSVTATFDTLDDYGNSMAQAATVGVASSTPGMIDYSADEDWFRFDLPGPGLWTIRTTGATDTVGEVFRADGSLQTSNDDSVPGSNNNFSITLAIDSATSLWVRVTGHAGTTGAYTLVSSFLPRRAVDDMNGDAHSDLLYRNVATGQIYRILMNGFSITDAALAYNEPNLSWHVVADADFNGDGVTDLLWRNDATGQIYMQFYDGSGVPTNGAVIWTEPNPAWKIVATPDFDGDGNADILWWNSVTGQVYGMQMSGAIILAAGNFYTEPNTHWSVVSAGDFAGSGQKNQLLWRNDITGQVYLMTVTVGAGTFGQSGVQIYQEPNLAWKIIGVADFNGDGKSDILWRNDATGQVYMMLMNGATIANATQVYAEPNLSWKIVATGDYDGDGKADILYRNIVTGQVYMLRMNGLAITGGGLVYTEPNLDWHVLGPYEYAQ